MNYEQIKAALERRGQGQILRYWSELDEPSRQQLLNIIERLDWSFAEEGGNSVTDGEIAPIAGLSRAEIARRREEYQTEGRRTIQEGKVAAVLLAGGQGTRLGSDAPKGAYNIGITKPVYIFERLIENLTSSCGECGAYVPLYIMTSELNDCATKAFLQEHNYFGYPAAFINFFMQDMSPCTDSNGKILLEEKGKPALSPNGNGGWYSSMARAGLLADAEKRGIEWFNVFAVDNVLQRIADPVFIGATVLSGCASGAKVVRKARPDEKVGVLCLRGGLPDVVEYYELPERLAIAKGKDGNLLYGDGVILNYLFRADKLKTVGENHMPVHKVAKKISYLDENGNRITAEALKYETLILDMVRLTGSCLPFEVDRDREFAPVKNLTGTDSVDTARELLRKNGVEL